MPLKKTYPKNKDICNVTFTYPDNTVSKVCVAGNFNDWDREALPMKKGKEGFSAKLELPRNAEFQYRFIVNDETWATDEAADDYIPGIYPDAQNGVIRT